jgi:hypothetical protein
MEGDHMRRAITIAIAVTMLSLVALILWQNAAAKPDAAVPAPEYVLSSHPYLPIRNLDPVW